MLDIVFAKAALPKSGALVLLLEEGGFASNPLFDTADGATDGAISRALAAADLRAAKASP